MKRFILMFIQLVFILTLQAQSHIKIVSADLNLRTAPSVSGAVIMVIPKGTRVAVDNGYNYQWVRVQYNSYIGYVHSKYLKTPRNNNVSYNKWNYAVKYYTNSFGERVQSPTYYNAAPAGATARCRDGTYSFSRNRRGTCSHHGGVAKWL
jgi:uncharacterized protein YraI